jgi:hypothetical protein
MFDDAWDQRETLRTRGCRIATLCRVHVFEHACVHAAVDRWNSLRHLIDIDRLASLLPESCLAAVSRHRAVRSSCALTFDLTGLRRLLSVADGPSGADLTTNTSGGAAGPALPGTSHQQGGDLVDAEPVVGRGVAAGNAERRLAGLAESAQFHGALAR